MIQRDFIMRQVHQLAQALARVMSLDLQRRESEGPEWLSQATSSVTGMDLPALRRATSDELQALCLRDGALSTELAVALADILAEDARISDGLDETAASNASRERARWLYALARDSGGTLPLHAHRMLSE